MALGALSALDDFGYSIPEDVSVIGFDDTLAAYSRPKLTTVAFPKQALGEQAVLRLISHIEGGKQPPAVHMLAPELVIRQSTKRVTEKNVR
jgi:LacI family repressor for deo operon, udp, cdd, tsx, nupC, and nupG